MTKREGEKQLNYWMPIDLHQHIRVQAAKEGLTLRDYICKVLKEDLDRKEENKNN